MTNVVRSTLGKGRGYSLVGHHKIIIPLIAAGVLEALKTWIPGMVGCNFKRSKLIRLAIIKKNEHNRRAGVT